MRQKRTNDDEKSSSGRVGDGQKFPYIRVYARADRDISSTLPDPPCLVGWLAIMSRYLITTKAVEATCHCGAAILRAIDVGLPVVVDAQPIPATDEVRVLIEGRWTYTRRRWSNELHHRTALMIHASDGAEPIHATHVCAPPAQPALFEGLPA